MSVEQVQTLRGERIAISGASGLVGTALRTRLSSEGVDAVKLVREANPQASDCVAWLPDQGVLQPERLEGLSAVVHLAGESIADGRWTAARKARIRDSRVKGTASLCRSLAELKSPPRTFVCASAVGYYGDRGDERLDESSPPGRGYLPEVCVAWEQACEPARSCGVRVVNVRFGVVLSRRGGALAKMLPPFRLGLGGRVGSGRQYMSWISLDDVVGAIIHVLKHAELSGPVNVVSPEPVTNAVFTRTLGSVLGRPTIFPVPASAARLALGQMADDLLLASARVLPDKLIASGYQFVHTELKACLTAELR